MFVVVQSYDNGEEVAIQSVFGPYDSHMKANGSMQDIFDNMVENMEATGEDIEEKDDSNADHFYLMSGDDITAFDIKEVETP